MVLKAGNSFRGLAAGRAAVSSKGAVLKVTFPRLESATKFSLSPNQNLLSGVAASFGLLPAMRVAVDTALHVDYIQNLLWWAVLFKSFGPPTD